MTPVHTLGAFALSGEVALRYGQNPKALQWLAELPNHLAQGELIYQLRNQIVVLPDPLEPSQKLCIKAFAAPRLLRRWWYTMVGCKAQRAHRYACHLYQPGPNSLTTEPLGYLQAANGQSFLLNRFLPNATDFYSEMHHLYTQRPLEPDFLRLLQRVAEACRRMHDLGFRHADLGPQNILLQRKETSTSITWPKLALIDLNRGQLKTKLSQKERAADLAHLRIPTLLQPPFNAFYLGEDTPPTAFTTAQHRQRQRIAWHVKTRRWRHPIRTFKRHFKLEAPQPKKELSTAHRSPLDAWLWNPATQSPTPLWDPAEMVRLQPDQSEFKAKHPAPIMQATPNAIIEFSLEENTIFLTHNTTVPTDFSDSPLVIKLLGQVGPKLSEIEQFVAGLPHNRAITMTFIPTRDQWKNPNQTATWISEVLAQLENRIQNINVGEHTENPLWGVWAGQEVIEMYTTLLPLTRKFPNIQWMSPWLSLKDINYGLALAHHLGPSVNTIAAKVPSQSTATERQQTLQDLQLLNKTWQAKRLVILGHSEAIDLLRALEW